MARKAKGIALEFSLVEDGGTKCLNIGTSQEVWQGFDSAMVLAEVGEALLRTSPSRIRYDFSNLRMLNSGCLGALMNLAEKAQGSGKDVRFRFASEVFDMIERAGMAKYVSIEK